MKAILISSLIFMLSVGCAVNKGKSLIVVTATNAGFVAGVNPLNQMPEVKLNYGRLEGMVVPVSDDKKINTVPVITKFNFKSMKNDPGIESLIATGDAANSDKLQNSGLLPK